MLELKKLFQNSFFRQRKEPPRKLQDRQKLRPCLRLQPGLHQPRLLRTFLPLIPPQFPILDTRSRTPCPKPLSVNLSLQSRTLLAHLRYTFSQIICLLVLISYVTFALEINVFWLFQISKSLLFESISITFLFCHCQQKKSDNVLLCTRWNLFKIYNKTS